jgi:hypothetical protein
MRVCFIYRSVLINSLFYLIKLEFLKVFMYITPFIYLYIIFNIVIVVIDVAILLDIIRYFVNSVQFNNKTSEFDVFWQR